MKILWQQLVESFKKIFKPGSMEIQRISFDYSRSGRPFIKGRIDVYVFDPALFSLFCERPDAISLDRHLRAKLLDYLNEKHELVRLCFGRRGRRGLKKIIIHFLMQKLPEMGLKFHTLNLDE